MATTTDRDAHDDLEEADTLDDEQHQQGVTHVDWDDDRASRRAVIRFDRDLRRARNTVRYWTSGPRWVSIVGWCVVAVWFAWMFGPFSFGNPRLWPLFGDTAPQSWFVSEFRDRLLSGSSPFGWTSQAGGGSFFGYFYFPLPATLFTLLSLVLPDPLAFKLLGVVALVGIIAAARHLIGSVSGPWVVRAAMFAAVTPFLFVNKVDTLGGDITSTLQGEYSFGIALAAALMFIAAFRKMLVGDGKVWPTVLWATAVALSHTNVAVVAATVAAGLLAVHRRRVGRVALAAGSVAALTAFWWMPLLQLRSEIAGNFRTTYASFFGVLFPPHWLLISLVGLAGLVTAAVRHRPGAALWLGMAGASLLWYLLGQNGLADGTLWAPRALPFLYLAMCAGWAYHADLIVHLFPLRPWRAATAGLLAVTAAAGVVLVGYTVTERAPYRTVYDGTYGRPHGAAYRELLDAAQELEPGLLVWSGRSAANMGVAYGSPDLDFDLVRATDGRLQTYGVFFLESFEGRDAMRLVHSMLNRQGPIIGTPRNQFTLDAFNRGIDMLREAGVRYLVVTEDEVRTLADAHGDLSLVTEVNAGAGDYEDIGVYEVSGHARVAALAVSPRVSDAAGDADILKALEQWMIDFAASTDADFPLLVYGDPAAWDKAGTRYGEPATVSNVRFDDEKVSFDVDRTGVPVVVRAGWSASWKADGAQGPYRAAPWSMVVVPTENHVELVFERPAGQAVGTWVSLLSAAALVAGCAGLALRRRRATRV